jgi:iron complex transport system substrate-binding protein
VADLLLRLLCAALLLAPCAARGGDVVSLNLCGDDFLLTLAPQRIAALTMLSRDPALSVAPGAAEAMRQVRADPEAVLALHPGLVLAGSYGAQATLAVLAERGVPILRLAEPRDFAQIRSETERVAAALGVVGRGQAALAQMDRVLAALPPASRRRALFLEPRGWSAGPADLADAVLRAAGLRPIGRGGAWSLEQVVQARPDLLVVPTAGHFPSLATALLDHPALRGIPLRAVSPAFLACGGPWSALAVREAAGE